MTMPIELKPCPFCGGTKLKIDSKSKSISYRHVDVFTASVRCNVCHARGGTASGECGNYYFGTPRSEKLTTLAEIEQRAAEAWNRRADDEPPKD
jgi:Lar family restriction alleviation protein